MSRKWKLDGMLVAACLTTIFYSATYPRIYQEVMRNLSADWIALQRIIICGSTVLFTSIWLRQSKRLFPLFPWLCVLEAVCTIGVAVWVTTGGSVASYYFLDTMVFALITRNLSCAGARLRALRYTTQSSREGFDNKQDAVMAVATITGSVLAIILDFDFTSLIWLATVGNIVDNVIYIGVYHKVTTSNT